MTVIRGYPGDRGWTIQQAAKDSRRSRGISSFANLHSSRSFKPMMRKTIRENHGLKAVLLFVAVCLFGGCDLRSSGTEKRKGEGLYHFNYTTEEAHSATRSPAAWEDQGHGAALGFDWRPRQAETALRLREAYHQPGRRTEGQYGPYSATWKERGPSRIPGRVTASSILPEQDRIYLLTDGGYLFRGTMAGKDWQCLNDHRPLGRGVDARLEVLPLPEGGNRIFAGGWDGDFLGPAFLRYSDDEGQTWQVPAGLPAAAWYRRTLISQSGKVWHMIRSDVSGTPRMVLLESEDFGLTFVERYAYPLGQGDYDRRCDMWRAHDSDTVFAFLNNTIIRLDPDGHNEWLTGHATPAAAPEWAILTGCRPAPDSAYTLFVRIWDGTENSIYRSSDGGNTWSRYGALVEGGLLWPFSNYAFAVHPTQPARLYSGGWIVGESGDGTNWRYPHDLGGYVGYHGDVPDIRFLFNPQQGDYDLYVGTDGGYYRYDPGSDQFVSLTPEGLHNTQIYKMASDHQAPHRIYIGTQDNGFVYNDADYTAKGIAPGTFLWGGDVTQVTSGDQGRSFFCFWWSLGCNYVKDARNMTTSGVANWGSPDFTYWEMPVKADPLRPDHCLIATPAPGQSRLKWLSAPQDLAAGELKPLAEELIGYDFYAASGGSRIGAIGLSPIEPGHIYVMTENGLFFWSLDHGTTWSVNSTAQNRIFPRYIAVSPTDPGDVYIGGAAYGNENPPVWRARQHGGQLEPAGAPSTSILRDNRVNALCLDPGGEYVFAAADVGAFAFSVAEGTWSYISGPPAPFSAFHDVEYFADIHTVRFATYARGVWDFEIEKMPTGIAANPMDALPASSLRPIPGRDVLTIDLSNLPGYARRISIIGINGKPVYSEVVSGDAATRNISASSWPAGMYIVRIDLDTGKSVSGKWLKGN